MAGVEHSRREQLVYLSKLCESSERYDEMAEFMKELVTSSDKAPLSVEERNLLSVAYKNAVGARRASWRIISSAEQKAKAKSDETNAKLAHQIRQKVEVELGRICSEILSLLENVLVPASTEAMGNAKESDATGAEVKAEEAASGAEGKKKDVSNFNAESLVFYLKMTADYHRYVSEFSPATEKQAASELSCKFYEEATTVAEKELVPTNSIRLGLALNFSVFHYEILNNSEVACRMAQDAFQKAVADLDEISEDSYKDATLIMQLLRDNLSLWNSSTDEPQIGNEAAPPAE